MYYFFFMCKTFEWGKFAKCTLKQITRIGAQRLCESFRAHKPERSCLMRPWVCVSMGRKSLNQVISGSGVPLAAHSMVAVRERSTTFSWGPISIEGKPAGSWSSEIHKNKQTLHSHLCLQWRASIFTRRRWSYADIMQNSTLFLSLLSLRSYSCRRQTATTGI